MKSALRNVFIVILSIAAAACMAVGLAACQKEAKVTELVLENIKTDFLVGDEFTLGDGVIYAVYDDGSKVDVTDKAELRKEPGFNMDVSDEYQITVSYGGKKEVYSIYVSATDNVLKKIELDTSVVKTQYNLGEAVSFEGLIITATYETNQGRPVIFNYTSVKNFAVEIKSQNGETVEDAFMELGRYTVTISQGNVKASYTVNVEGISISTVQSAINIGKIFSYEVASGTQSRELSQQGGDYFDDMTYTYTYGDNYTYVKETFISKTLDGTEEIITENHFSLVDGEIFCARYENGNFASNPPLLAEMMEGPVNTIWYEFLSVYGIENTLVYLYKGATESTNDDLVETADVASRTYSFTYSGLVNNASVPDYYETTVTFTLGEKYNIQSAEYTQKYWENNQHTHFEHTFTTDANGKTTPNTPYSRATHVVVGQETGERTATNPHSKSEFSISSFDLTYNGETLDAPNATIQCSMDNPKLQINIANIQPATANFTLDRMYFSYVGYNYEPVDSATALDFGPSRGFGAYRIGNTIYVNLKGGGSWTLLITTDNIEKSITFEVTGEAPTAIESFIRNESSGNFYAGDEKTITLNGAIYFYGNVAMGLNNRQTASVTSENASTATIEEAEIGGIACFKFTASAAGVYTVRVVSEPNVYATCDFTFTVTEAPDYAELLSGKYTVTDAVGNVYDLTFTLDNTDEVTGTVTVVKTLANSEDTLSQTYDFSINAASMEILLVGDDGDRLGIDITISAEGDLVLNDVNENNYILQRVSE